MTDAQTTSDRATSAYDHERALMEAITRTIFETSAVSDADAIVIRTAECAQASVIDWPVSSRCRRQRHAHQPQSAAPSTISASGFAGRLLRPRRARICKN